MTEEPFCSVDLMYLKWAVLLNAWAYEKTLQINVLVYVEYTSHKSSNPLHTVLYVWFKLNFLSCIIVWILLRSACEKGVVMLQSSACACSVKDVESKNPS